MAVVTDTLIVELQAKLDTYNANIKSAQDKFERFTSKLTDAAGRAEKATEQMGSRIKNAIAGIGLSIGILEITRYADAWTSAVNKIKSAGGLTDPAALAATQKVADIAAESRSDFTATADLYARLSRTGKDFGKSQGEVTIATEAVAKALKLAGATGAETESTLVQLGQALGSGRLQGDELRSLLENAPVIAQAIAKEFGVTVGQLKTLGEEGKLVSDRVFNALIKAAPEISAAFAKTTATISESFKQLEAAAIKFIGTSGQMSTAGQLLSAVTQAVAKNFDAVASGALALGAIIVSRLVASGLTPLITSFGAAVTASGATAAGFGAVGLGATIAATAVRVLSGALRLIGGIPGAIVLGLGTVIGYFVTRAREGDVAGRYYAAALDEVKAAADRANPSIDKTAQAVDAANKKMLQASVSAVEADYAKLKKSADEAKISIEGATSGIEKFRGVNINAEDKARLVDLLTKAMKDDSAAAIAAAAEIDRLGKVNPGFEAAFGSIATMLRNLSALTIAANNAHAALDRARNAQSADETKSSAARDQAALFAAGVPRIAPTGDTINSDPVIARIRLQREVALAEMDETKKKLADKTKEIYDKSLETGGGVTLAEAEAAAKRIIAAEDSGGGAKKREDSFQKEMRQIQDRTRLLNAETAAQAALNPLINDYGFSVEYARQKQELLNAAKKANVTVTPEVARNIDVLATAYANAVVEAAKLAEAQQKIVDTAREWNDTAKEVTKSFISDLKSGKSALEALGGALNKIADKLLDMAANSLFDNAFGGKKSGGLFGFISNLFGGLFGGGKPSGGLGLPALYDKGGPTGGTNPRRAAGIVHEQEVVFNKQDVARHGGVGAVEALRKGGAQGVPMPVPVMPRVVMPETARSGGDIHVSIAPVFDNKGAGLDVIQATDRQIAELRATLPAIVVKSVREARTQGMLK